MFQRISPMEVAYVYYRRGGQKEAYTHPIFVLLKHAL